MKSGYMITPMEDENLENQHFIVIGVGKFKSDFNQIEFKDEKTAQIAVNILYGEY